MTGEPDLLSFSWRRPFPGLGQAELFDLVQDIESYPLFVPGCIATRIVSREEGRWIVDNTFGLGPVRSRFTTLASLDPPRSIDLTSTDGPWRQFEMAWRFETVEGVCHVGCGASLSFRSPLIARLAGMAIKQMQATMIQAFEERARKLRAGKRPATDVST